MNSFVNRKPIKILPDFHRVIARLGINSEARSKQLIKRVLELPDKEVEMEVFRLLRGFSDRHRNTTRIFERHCERMKPVFQEMQINYKKIEPFRRLLIGAYFTMEYSVASVGFFNPGMVEDIDQSDLQKGEKRVIISFRVVGEGHISSIVFRRAIIDAQNNINIQKENRFIDEPETYRETLYDKNTFFHKASSIKLPPDVKQQITESLPDKFDYDVLKKLIRKSQQQHADHKELRDSLERCLWIANTHYEMHFSWDTDISDRVIYPHSDAESKGMEDARFVKFTEDDGEVTYYATYTAYDGRNIQPGLMKTKDFYRFRTMPLYGEGAQNKNLALFPRKVNGKYAMFSRIDGVNNYIMYSDDINIWETPIKIQEPKYTWEFIQIGNCGSPIETEYGWLLITHGVGPMRKYVLSASLFDLDNPSRELGRLKNPLMIPLEEEREGYVPNVIYSCGSLIHNDELILPYGISDYASSFATIPLKKLVETIMEKD